MKLKFLFAMITLLIVLNLGQISSASYPQPYVKNGNSQTATENKGDMAGAFDLQTKLNALVTKTSTTTTVTGESIQLERSNSPKKVIALANNVPDRLLDESFLKDSCVSYTKDEFITIYWENGSKVAGPIYLEDNSSLSEGRNYLCNYGRWVILQKEGESCLENYECEEALCIQGKCSGKLDELFEELIRRIEQLEDELNKTKAENKKESLPEIDIKEGIKEDLNNSNLSENSKKPSFWKKFFH